VRRNAAPHWPRCSRWSRRDSSYWAPSSGWPSSPGLLVYRFDAPLFFANAALLREQVLRLVDESTPPVREVVLDAEGIVDMDITGAETLDELLDDLDERGTRLVLARTRTALRDTLRRLDLEERIGPENFHLRVRDAVAAFSDRASG
jgi:sulfate permease, SulP family